MCGPRGCQGNAMITKHNSRKNKKSFSQRTTTRISKKIRRKTSPRESTRNLLDINCPIARVLLNPSITRSTSPCTQTRKALRNKTFILVPLFINQIFRGIKRGPIMETEILILFRLRIDGHQTKAHPTWRRHFRNRIPTLHRPGNRRLFPREKENSTDLILYDARCRGFNGFFFLDLRSLNQFLTRKKIYRVWTWRIVWCDLALKSHKTGCILIAILYNIPIGGDRIQSLFEYREMSGKNCTI